MTDRFALIDPPKARAERQVVLNELAAKVGLKDSDNDVEPWIFRCHLDYANWKVSEFGFDRRPEEKKWFCRAKETWLIATRSRFVAMTLAPRHKAWVREWQYAEFANLKVSRPKTDLGIVTVTTHDGLRFSLYIKTPGTRFIDKAALMSQMLPQNYTDSEFLIAASNMATARRKIAESASNQVEFLSLIGDFWQEASSPAR